MTLPSSKILLSATVLALWSVLATAPALAAVGTFQFVHGTVTLAEAKGVERAAKKGDTVDLGDVVTTSDNGVAHIQMADGTLLSVRSASRVRIEQYHTTNATGQKLLGLLYGGLRALTRTLRGTAGLQVRTDVAVIGVRGTDHEVHHVLPDRGPPGAKPGTYDRVFDGQTFMQTEGGKLDLRAKQVGFAERRDKPPVLLDSVPGFLATGPARVPPTVSAGSDERSSAAYGLLASAGGQTFPPSDFVQAPTSIATMQAIGGVVTFNTVTGYSLPVAETGAVGGRVDSISASVNLTTLQLTGINIGATDALSRTWSASTSAPVSIGSNGTFVAPFTTVTCSGCTAGIANGSASVVVMGSDAGSIQTGYNMVINSTFTYSLNGTVNANR